MKILNGELNGKTVFYLISAVIIYTIPVTVRGANSNVLIKPLGGSVALPSDVTITPASGDPVATYTSVQVGGDGMVEGMPSGTGSADGSSGNASDLNNSNAA